MKINIPKKISDYWTSYKHKYNPILDSYSSSSNILGNNLYWTVPNEVIWLYATNNEESYEGSQTQIGITIDGTIVWGYFSHCSCYGYEDYKGEFEELKEDNLIHTEKYYELNNIDKHILAILKERVKEMSEKGIKDKENSK